MAGFSSLGEIKVGMRVRDISGNNFGEGEVIKVGPTIYEVNFPKGWKNGPYTAVFASPNSVELISTSPTYNVMDPTAVASSIVDAIKKYSINTGAYDKSPIPVAKESMTDISDWRKWRMDQPGHCACGIAKQDCTYHKS